ncbi:EAL domain-containing protein [Pelotomaculum schinkii]|uniref:EAL domain-containing protein n=1 Tax=Pelotomaculum schinkii TaxID=78350 RepID=UPI00167E7CC9|nr:EAL domain-containing protein [Pelotomaculum schinkii]
MKKTLENVLANRLITTVFQPVIHIETGRIIGYEALSRGPEGPLQEPLVLFSLATEFGYAMKLEQLCLASAMENSISMPTNLRLFINLSPFAVENGILDVFDHELTELTVIEITEAGVINDYSKVKKVIDFYRRRGIKIAVDDVGNGYDRLRSIAELEPDWIKIDRGLIQGCYENKGRRRVLKHLVALAAELKAKVVAEGIEKVDELNIAGVIGIHYAQGFYLGKPQSKPWENLMCAGDNSHLSPYLVSKCF